MNKDFIESNKDFIEEDTINLKSSSTNTSEIEIKQVSKVIVPNSNYSSMYNEFLSLLNNLQFHCKDVECYEIKTEDDFFKYQHKIFENFYVVMSFENNALTIADDKGKVFIIYTDLIRKGLYLSLLEATKPRKIIYCDAIYDLHENCTFYNLKYAIEIFYNLKINSLSELANMFYQNVNNFSTHQLMQSLFLIKDKFNNIIEKNNLMNFFNKEMTIYCIINKIKKIGLPFNKDVYEKFSNDLKIEYSETISYIEKEYNFKYIDNLSLINALTENQLVPSLFQCYYEFKNDPFLSTVKIISEYYKCNSFSIKNTKENNLMLNYNPYGEYGNIDTLEKFNPIYIGSDNKKILVGIYDNLFYRILAEISNIDEIINIFNKKDKISLNPLENDLILNLSKSMFDEDNAENRLSTFLIMESLLRGYDNHEASEFIKREYDTILSDNDILDLETAFKMKCTNLYDLFIRFKKCSYTVKRYYKYNMDNAYAYIRTIESNIVKELLLTISTVLDKYNQKNKAKINIAGVIDNGIILSTEGTSSKIAQDILNRYLVHVYNKFMKKVRCVCLTTESSHLNIPN